MGNSRDGLIDDDFEEDDSMSIYQNTMSTLTNKKGSSLMCRYVNICCGLHDCVVDISLDVRLLYLFLEPIRLNQTLVNNS